MNYVTSFFGSVKGYYDGINGATLTGALDVIVVRQPDTSFISSPFHVRFGKLNVLQSNEKLVDITVNGRHVSLQMKLGSNGEAFFVKECDEDDIDDAFSPEYSTSPIQTDIPVQLRQGVQRMRQESTYTESSIDDYIDSDSSDDPEDDYYGEYSYGPEDQDCLSDSELLANQYTQQRIDSNNTVIWDWGTLPHENRQTETATTYNDEAGTSFMRGMWEYMGHRRKRKNTYSGTVVTTPPAPLHHHLHHSTTTAPPAPLDHTQDRQEGMFLDDIDTEDPNAVSHYFGIANTPRSLRRARMGDIEANEMLKNEEKFRRLDALSLEAPRYHTSSSLSVCTEPIAIAAAGIHINVQTQTRAALPKRNKRTQTIPDSCANDSVDICLSLCGEDVDAFNDYAVTYEQIEDDHLGILDDPNLIVKCGEDYFNWTQAPNEVLLAMAFREYRTIVETDACTESEWEQERNRSTTYCSDDAGEQERNRSMTYCSDDAGDEEAARGPRYKKTVRLTSEDIASLELVNGPNYLTFSVTTSLQGTTKCICTVYLWDYTDKIIISDIDGTITRSDVFGHILPWVGKDWTQNNIAKLFTALEGNGYKFLYLSSRAIGQASMTKNFLRTIKQNGIGIPEGPMLLSPDSLLRAIKDELVLKCPHIFKIRCLTDIKKLFGEGSEPFYAGFGNRISDSKSYEAVGIPKHRVYIINHRGEIYTENSLVQVCTYAEIFEVNELYFPPLHTRAGEETVEEEFLTQNFWRIAIRDYDEADLVL